MPRPLASIACSFLMWATTRFSSRPLAMVTDFEWSVMAMYSWPSCRGGFGHLLDGVLAVAGGRVHLEVALDVGELDQLRQLVLLRRRRSRRCSREVPAGRSRA